MERARPLDHDRRNFLRTAGWTSLAGLAGLAGCLGDDGGGDTSEPGIDPEPDYKGWFKGVSNYSGTRDRRGQDTTTVGVGTSANGGNFGFGPPAIAVSPETTVQWDWTGQGGQHNVVAQSGAFDSGRAVTRADATFENTFDQPGVFAYVCEPHREVGMRGAVFVALE